MTYRINQTNKTTNPKIKSPTLQPETANATDLVCGFGCSCDITTSLRPPSLSLRFFVFLAIVNYLSSESGVSCSSRNIKIGCHADIICLLIFIKSTQLLHSRGVVTPPKSLPMVFFMVAKLRVSISVRNRFQILLPV